MIHKPKWGPRREWIYPQSEDVLQECKMKTMEEYIQVHWQMIVVYIATRLILDKFRQGEQRRGAVPAVGGGNSPWTWTSTTQLGQTSDSSLGHLLSLLYRDEYVWWV